jgi:four helix bundle protein
MEDFKDLQVWQKAHELTLAVYHVSRRFPKEELYGLTAQMRRAAASMGANVAEGCGRRSDGELRRFLQIARGSANELEYHLILAKDLGLLTVEEFAELESRALQIQRMLASFVQRLQGPAQPGARSQEPAAVP